MANSIDFVNKVKATAWKYWDALRDNDGKIVSDVDDTHAVYINQFYAEKFNLNEAGWPRNDISAFEHAESESEAASILARLEEQKETNDVFKDLSDDEKFELCVPRRATTDAVLYARYMLLWAQLEKKRIEVEMKELEDSKKAEEEAKKASEAKFAEDVKKVVSESSDSSKTE